MDIGITTIGGGLAIVLTSLTTKKRKNDFQNPLPTSTRQRVFLWLKQMISRIPAGMRYYIGAEARLRRTVEDVAMSVFEGWNYEEVITPSVDYYDLLRTRNGPAEAQRGFRFTDNDGRLLALRPDVTSSVARVAATLFADRPRPLRFCYAAPVFRQQPQSHAEWRRENTQLGCELIGAGRNVADLEILRLAAEILTRLNLESRYCITINNVEFFNGIAAAAKSRLPLRENILAV